MSQGTLIGYAIALFWVDLFIALAASGIHVHMVVWAKRAESSELPKAILLTSALAVGSAALSFFTFYFLGSIEATYTAGTDFKWWWDAYGIMNSAVVIANFVFMLAKLSESWILYQEFREANPRESRGPSIFKVWRTEFRKKV